MLLLWFPNGRGDLRQREPQEHCPAGLLWGAPRGERREQGVNTVKLSEALKRMIQPDVDPLWAIREGLVAVQPREDFELPLGQVLITVQGCYAPLIVVITGAQK